MDTNLFANLYPMGLNFTLIQTRWVLIYFLIHTRWVLITNLYQMGLNLFVNLYPIGLNLLAYFLTFIYFKFPPNLNHSCGGQGFKSHFQAGKS